MFGTVVFCAEIEYITMEKLPQTRVQEKKPFFIFFGVKVNVHSRRKSRKCSANDVSVATKIYSCKPHIIIVRSNRTPLLWLRKLNYICDCQENQSVGMSENYIAHHHRMLFILFSETEGMTELFQSMLLVFGMLAGNVKHEGTLNVWKVKLCKSPKIRDRMEKQPHSKGQWEKTSTFHYSKWMGGKINIITKKKRKAKIFESRNAENWRFHPPSREWRL